jgi:hypothetical protein
MQVTKYTEAIPVDQLKVGDIILNHVSWTPFTYISSIKKCSAAQGTYKYFKFNTKRLGARTKDKVYDDFTSEVRRNPYNSHSVVFYNKNVTVIRLNSTDDRAKFVASWKNIVQCFEHAVSLYEVCAALYKTPVYYGAAYLLELLGNDSKLQEVLEDKITDAISDSIKQSILMEELGLESVDQYKEFCTCNARDIARLILRGESVLDIRNRVAAWKLAYTEKEEAAVRMQQAFVSAK